MTEVVGKMLGISLQNIVPASAIYHILQTLKGTEYYDIQKEIFLSRIPAEDKELLSDIESGRKLPPITSDIVFKRIFDPVSHKNRLEYLLKGISGKPDITIRNAVANEGYRESIFSKSIIFDLPATAESGLMTNTEMQVAAQKFILKRGEIISANQMMIQYSAAEGQAKGDINFDNVYGTLLTVLMKGTPEDFSSYKTDRYIHVFDEAKSNTGLTYKTLQNIAYVELSKCLDQYRNGRNGEEDNALQAFLSMISDVNDDKVQENINSIYDGEDIVKELKDMSQNKEVRTMMMAERYAAADLNAALAHARDEGEQRGEQRGELKGELTKSLQVFQNCLDRGMSREDAIALAAFPADYDTSQL